MSDVDALRRALRDRGYLTHGIERWFALDPWSSRTFWVELAMVALKAAILIAAFAALPMAAVMVFRNYPLHALETFGLFVSYAAVWVVLAFAFVVAIALILKLRPSLPIDTPRALLAISLAASAVLVAPVAIWWYGFDADATLPELVVGVALCAIFFLVATIVISAAMLSFSIYELQRVPAIHQRPRGVPMIVAAAVLIALLFVPAYADRERTVIAPMVVTKPTTTRIALIAVDGLTREIFQQRLPHARAIAPLPAASTTERWASLGTGVRTEEHGVRAIEGVRFRGGSHVLQRLSPHDFVLMRITPLLGVARREPLPPTVRRREYVWEIVAHRGVPSVAVNWWATADAHEGGLHAVGPESIFSAARGDALRVDALATSRFLELLDREQPRFATVYLPALDVILNRLDTDETTRLATSIRALEHVTNTIALVRARGYEVVLVGMPGERQRGTGVIESTRPLAARSAWEVAPALLDLLGFPASEEMPGGATNQQARITSYGPRETRSAAPVVNDDYYQNLKSLGYIR